MKPSIKYFQRTFGVNVREKSAAFVSLIITIVLSACIPAAPLNRMENTKQNPPITITVMAAASLTEPFKEIGLQFEKMHPGVQVTFNFAGSQQLARQIEQGAVADVFASASRKYMDELADNGLLTGVEGQLFARNKLVVILPPANPGNIIQINDLAKPGIQVILAAKEVPAGDYALQFIAKASKDQNFGPEFEENMLKNVVSYEENVKSVLAKVILGEADAGIVYASDAGANKVQILGIPDNLNIIADYPISPIKSSQHVELANRFVEYVLSLEGQAILEKSGFLGTNP